MAFNPTMKNQWDLNTPNSGLLLNSEFANIYEFLNYLKDRELPVGTILMYDGNSWQDNITLPGWYACVAENTIQGCPDLTDRFIMGVPVTRLKEAGGANQVSHEHNVTSAVAVSDHTVLSHSLHNLTQTNAGRTVANLSHNHQWYHHNYNTNDYTFSSNGSFVALAGGGTRAGVYLSISANRTSYSSEFNMHAYTNNNLSATTVTATDHNHNVQVVDHADHTISAHVVTNNQVTSETKLLDNRPNYYSTIFIRRCV